MAATNYTPIQLYRTTTLAAVPVSGNLTSGELAINVNDADMALYAKNNTGNVKRLMNNPAGLKYPTADGTANQVIKTDGAGTLSFSTPTTGTVTSVGGTGTVSGITLTGTVTSSGSLTLGGTLSLASPPTIGNTTANTGAFTTLSASGQLTLTKATGYNLYASGIGNNYMAGSLGIGSLPVSNVSALYINKVMTGVTTVYGVANTALMQSDVTTASNYFWAQGNTQAAAFTLTNLRYFYAAQGTFGAGSTVSNQFGFFVDSDAIGATNNYGFTGNIPAGTGRYNLYMAGTADNYMAGSLGIGAVPPNNINILVQKNLSGSADSAQLYANPSIQADVIGAASIIVSAPSTAASVFTLGLLRHVYAHQNIFGAGSAVTSQVGFVAANSLIGATNNYGFSGNIPAGTGRYNLFMNGTADNYLAGSLGIGGVPTADTSLLNVKPLVGGLTSFATRATGIVQSTVTTDAQYYSAVGQTAAAAFTLANLRGFYYRQSAIGAGSTLTAQFGFYVDSDAIGATNNRAFCGVIPSGTGRYNLYMSGTAANYLAGDLQLGKVITPSGTNGAQSINTTTGSVNFAIAATSLVVTNSLVTANSVIIATVASNDTTMKSVQVVAAAGSFTIYANAAATAATRVNFLITN